MFKKIVFFFSFLSVSLLLATPAFALAVCPVCTIVVGAGIGLSRWLGVDDLITGTWVGALIISLVFWTMGWLNKKAIKFPLMVPVIAAAFYILTLLPLYFSGIIGHPYNKFCGIDKIVFGSAIGSAVFLAAIFLNNYLKKRNNGKVYFPYQKVVIPISFLIITSLIIYLISKC